MKTQSRSASDYRKLSSTCLPKILKCQRNLHAVTVFLFCSHTQQFQCTVIAIKKTKSFTSRLKLREAKGTQQPIPDNETKIMIHPLGTQIHPTHYLVLRSSSSSCFQDLCNDRKLTSPIRTQIRKVHPTISERGTIN